MNTKEHETHFKNVLLSSGITQCLKVQSTEFILYSSGDSNHKTVENGILWS